MKLILRPFFSFTKYKVPYNINIEQKATYLKKVSASENFIHQNYQAGLIPRRQRRIYDRPRIDKNIQGYGAWRVFDPEQIIHKQNEHSMRVELKLLLQPKWVIHAFGIGGLSQQNPRSSDREYHFVDNRLNSYTLYQYRNTTHFRQNIAGYNYQNQEDIKPIERKKKRVSPEQFWNSQQKFQFRVNASLYAQKYKFEEWLGKEIENWKSKQSYDQYIDEKYGTVCTFNKKQDSSRFQPYQPMVTNITPQHFAVGGKKAKQIQPPKVRLGNKMDQKYRIKQKITRIGPQAQVKNIENTAN